MGDGAGSATPVIDGRRARRDRGRTAVVDAMFELLQAGTVPPGAELVAERAGVSVASIFRYFDGLDDLQYQTFERFRERFEPVIAVVDARGALPDRIDRLIDARLDLYERAGMIMTVGRLRALEHAPMVEASARMRGLLADQVRALLRPETDRRAPADAAELVAVVDALTSLDSWDVMRRTHGRTRRQIADAWRRGITALIDDTNDDIDNHANDHTDDEGDGNG